MDKHDSFIEAIHSKKKIKVTIDSKEKGIIVRTCIPFDYGPSRRYKSDRYHMYNLDSPSGPHNISILPEQLIRVELTDENFEPGHYVTWDPDWNIERDWGKYS